MAPFFCGALWILFAAQSAIADLVSSQEAAIDASEKLDLANSPTWQSLLHFQNGKCHITDPKYLLSGTPCSLKSELVKTIGSFYLPPTDENHSICKFPARYYFIQESLVTEQIILPKRTCKDLDEYLGRAPAESISLVFASENISQPSSMMGHVFLKLSGANKAGFKVEHAVSYFTRINSLNVPLLIAESMFIGMPSFYSLVPYSEQLEMYLHKEERSVWEYALDLSEDKRKLIHLHIWELKDVKSKYFFVGYNCATVVYFILSIAEPSFLDTYRLWVTPLDVAKQANLSGLISSSSVLPSDKWKVRMLASALDDKIQEQVHKAVRENAAELLTPTDDDKLNFLQRELASAYSTYLFNSGKLRDEEYREHKQNFASTDISSGTAIDISEFKNPLKMTEDSQVGLGYFNRESNSYLRFDLLPASHKLTDDNRQLFSESSLELGSISFLANLEKSSISLEEFKLFSATSLIPRDRFTGGLSGRFEMGVEQHLDKLLNNYSAGYISGGLGFSKAIHENIFVYSMANVGAAYGKQNFYPFASPEVGIFIEEAFDMKGIGSYELVCGQDKSFPCYQKLTLSQSIYLNSSLALILSYGQAFRSDNTEHIFEAGLRNYF